MAVVLELNSIHLRDCGVVFDQKDVKRLLRGGAETARLSCLGIEDGL
jgi:hypothetical protein